MVTMSLMCRLRDNIEELRRSLEPKENALEGVATITFGERAGGGIGIYLWCYFVELLFMLALSYTSWGRRRLKLLMLEDMRGLLQAADDKRQAAIAELSAKHQKVEMHVDTSDTKFRASAQIESLEAQLSDELADRSKATETISALQKKSPRLQRLDAASSGEAARFRAAMETVPFNVSQQILVVNHDVLDVDTVQIDLNCRKEKEKKSWEATTQALKTKWEVAESSCVRAEIQAAKMRSQLELELSVQGQLLSTRDAELKTAKEEINRLETEFSSYKARAHTLLQRKDAELAAARDNELLKEHEEALKEAEKEVQLVSTERDRAIQDLQDALANHSNELAARDEALSSAEQKIKSMQIKLTSADARYHSEKEAWEINLQNLEETWRLRCEALKAQKEVSPSPDLQKELEDLKLLYKKLKEEHDSFRDLADKLIEEKDKEISRLIDDNKNLRKSLELRPLNEQNYSYTAGTKAVPVTFATFQKQDAAYSSTSAAEQQILILARQQAQREEELAQSQRHILALQEEIEELERENRLHSQQEAMLKEEFRNMERSKKREGVDMTYLKNVILKLLQTGEVEALLPVVAMLLQFSPDEMQKCQQASRSSTDVPPSPASDTSGSGFSLFHRFSFS
ncbi:golgi-localized GRIP domain-containing protein [Actinidia rufa]|uniref:Golgi-localized GRIP domain-containing protein n=1 Tax=Actinidia rufa TaxID=165716 RepID=A0A7J0ENC7_9ERIC|nr:golgi-localized GRIP domain-containing protein [Actinidia rufa]